MTISHFVVKYGTRAKGDSSATNYQNLVSPERVEHLEHQNYPDWARDNPQQFWQASDKYEPAHEKIYVRIESPLPRELSKQERLGLTKTFLQQKLSSHPYTLVIRNSISPSGQENPHFAVLFSERIIDEVKRSHEQFFKPANTKEPARGGAAKERYWTHLPNIAALHDSWKRAVRMALQESEPQELTSGSRQKVNYSPQTEVAVREITASTLYELVGQRKQALYKKLGELNAKRYQMGVRWTTNGLVKPTPLSAPQAYEKALKTLGGLKYLEAENRWQQAARHLKYLQQKLLKAPEKSSQARCPQLNLSSSLKPPTSEKYYEAIEREQQARQNFERLRLSLEREPNRLQSVMNQLLIDDGHKHWLLHQLETDINFLTGRVYAAKQFQAELALLGEAKIAIGTKVSVLDVTRLIVDRGAYQALLRSAWSYHYLQSLSVENARFH